MNTMKDFFSENKSRVMIAVAIVVTIVVIFILTAVISKGRNAADQGSTQELDITTLANEETIGLEDATVDQEMGNIDDEVTTDPNAVINTELPYLIKVNRAANCITVYSQDSKGEYTVPYKAIVCSTGKNVGDTPLGDFQTLISYNWLLMVDGTYGQFAYRFYGSILFHSVPYYTKDKSDLEYAQFNKLGEPASLGCVRVCVRDAIWLIENCPVGTEVIVYDDADSPGPLGKPEMIKIPEDSPNRGWDPTDPDPKNPWNDCNAKITVDSAVTIAVGKYSNDTIVERIGAVATDTCGNDITDKIKVTGFVNYKKTGSGTIVLTVTDAIGRSDTKVVKIQVAEKEVTTVKPTTTKKETTTVQETTTLPQETTTLPAETTTNQQTTKQEQTTTQKQTEAATSKTVVLNMLTSKSISAGAYATINEVFKEMSCTAKYSDGTTVNDASQGVKVDSGTYNLKEPGIYKLQVKYTDSQGISSGTMTVTITVNADSVTLNVKTPSIEVSAGEYAKITDVFSKMGMEAVDSRGNAMSNVAATVKASETPDLSVAGSYPVKVSITDSYGVTSAEVTVTITVVEAVTDGQ